MKEREIEPRCDDMALNRMIIATAAKAQCAKVEPGRERMRRLNQTSGLNRCGAAPETWLIWWERAASVIDMAGDLGWQGSGVTCSGCEAKTVKFRRMFRQ